MAQLAARLVRDQEVGRSNRLTPTAREVEADRLGSGSTRRVGGFDSCTSYGGVAQWQSARLISGKRKFNSFRLYDDVTSRRWFGYLECETTVRFRPPTLGRGGAVAARVNPSSATCSDVSHSLVV